ncbi:hypothetical protein BBP40_010444 [Aspergillus hancockii]|nr:hypothetical protein BBP40_010444 [Aspergillus hancockii]
MYEPPPPRVRRANINRSRNGCVPCRRKKRKCNEARPQCDRCTRTGAICWFQKLPFRFRSVNIGRNIRWHNPKERPRDSDVGCRVVLSQSARHGLRQEQHAMHNSNAPARDPPVPPVKLFNGDRKQLPLITSAARNKSVQLRSTVRHLLSSYIFHISQDKLRTCYRKVSVGLSLESQSCLVCATPWLHSLQPDWHTESEPWLSPSTIPLLRKPRPQHFLEALSHFSSAVQQVRAHPADIESVLAAVILFNLFELELGTLWGVHCHVTGLEKLLMLHQNSLMEYPYGRTLLRAGLFIRIRALFLLGPLSSLSTESATVTYLQGLVGEESEPRETIYVIMTKAVSMTTRSILMHCWHYDSETWHCSEGSTSVTDFKTCSKHRTISLRVQP